MKIMTKILAVSMALAFPTLVMAAPGAAGGILATSHDFASGTGDGAGFLATQTGTGAAGVANNVGLCSYCHTPHQALQTALLWNHTLSSNTFTWDEAKTAGGTAYASIAPTHKGPTVKCLSCHDGSVAIGDVSLWSQKLKGNPGVIAKNTYQIGAGMTRIGSGGNMAGNHPVAMPYPYGQVANTYNSKTTGADVVTSEFVADPTLSATAKIKLYSNSGASNVPSSGLTGMECSSCHDPHNKSTTDVLFLRGKIAGSSVADGYLCVQCHTK